MHLCEFRLPSFFTNKMNVMIRWKKHFCKQVFEEKEFCQLKILFDVLFFIFFFSAIVEKYLLEKSRIVSQAKNERYAQTSTAQSNLFCS